MAPPLDLFYSYSKQDEKYLNDLKKYLSLLTRIGLIRDWSDHDIEPGSQWEGIIDDKIKGAQIILFLVSVDFLTSDRHRARATPGRSMSNRLGRCLGDGSGRLGCRLWVFVLEREDQ